MEEKKRNVDIYLKSLKEAFPNITLDLSKSSSFIVEI